MLVRVAWSAQVSEKPGITDREGIAEGGAGRTLRGRTILKHVRDNNTSEVPAKYLIEGGSA